VTLNRRYATHVVARAVARVWSRVPGHVADRISGCVWVAWDRVHDREQEAVMR
jgi:hypothetical protein